MIKTDMASLNKDELQFCLKKKKVCRFCLCVNPQKLTNIYMRDTRIKSSAPLPIQIMAIASIEVFSNDEMPSYVCTDCTNMFEFSYQFKQMCKKADNLLRQFPLTGKWPKSLDRPVLMFHPPHGTIEASNKLVKTNPVRMKQHSPKSGAQQKSVLLPKKILNHSVNSNIADADNPDSSQQPEQNINLKVIPKVEEERMDCTITFLDKIENNDELSFDDIQQLVAAEGISDADFNIDNIPETFTEPVSVTNKPKLLNKSSIRILNKEAEPENEPRLSLPKITQDVNGKMEIVAEILNVGEMPEGEKDLNIPATIETKVFSCLYCERSFPLLQLRDIHMKNHLRDRNFKCDWCEKSFLSKYDLQRHVFLHNGEKPYKCSVCDKGFSRSTTLGRHEMSHTDIPKYICVHCERSFLTIEDMQKHEKKHKINRPFECKICKKRFAFKQGVERHEVIHSREQPYPCEYCEQSFSTPTKLARHLTAHAGSRPYPCKYCKKSYLLSHHLRRHMRSHKNVDDPNNCISFMCMRCNTSFRSRDELITHSAAHASEMNLACPLCKDEFSNMDGLTSHIQEHSEGEAYACEFCDMIFLTAEKLQAHTYPEHAQEMEAYHRNDREQDDNNKGDITSQKCVDNNDENFQNTVNEFLSDDLPCEGNGSDNLLVNKIKKEPGKRSPKIINKIITETSVDAPNVKKQSEDDKSLLIPLKQRKLDLSDRKDTADSKTQEETEESPKLRRKLPNAAGARVATKDSYKHNNQSLLKSSISENTPKTSIKKPIKTPPSKTPPNTTPSPQSKVIVSKKIILDKLISNPKLLKVESTRSEESSSPDLIIKKKTVTVTKAQAAAMAKQGRIKIKDGKIVLKK